MGEVGQANQETERKERLNILLVEDEKSLVPVIELALEAHNVTAFESAEEALDALRRAKEEGASFDWVITDRGLAGKMDGFGLAGLIKKDQLGNPYVTMISGSAGSIRDEKSPEQLEKEGINQLIGKPFNPIKELNNSVNIVREFRQQSQNPQT